MNIWRYLHTNPYTTAQLLIINLSKAMDLMLAMIEYFMNSHFYPSWIFIHEYNGYKNEQIYI